MGGVSKLVWLYGTQKCGLVAEATRIGLNGPPRRSRRIWLGFVARLSERFTDKPIWEGKREGCGAGEGGRG